MRSPCHAARAALIPALLGGCISGPSNRPPRPQPAPPVSVVEGYRYQEVVEWGTRLASEMGYSGRLLEAVPLNATLWRVRFEIAPPGGRFLELELDTAGRRLRRFLEVEELTQGPPPLVGPVDGGLSR